MWRGNVARAYRELGRRMPLSSSCYKLRSLLAVPNCSGCPLTTVVIRETPRSLSPKEAYNRQRFRRKRSKELQNVQRSAQRIRGRNDPPTTNTNNVSDGSENPIFSEAHTIMGSLQRRLSLLEPLSPVWSDKPVPQPDERDHIYHSATTLMLKIEAALRNNQLQPSKMYANETSLLLGKAMQILSEIPSDHTKPVFSYCWKLLALLKESNSEPLSMHYEAAIQVAARESKWKEATSMFWHQIDLGASASTALQISTQNPVGFYAIAKHAQSIKGATAEQVMDAALAISMVSPTNQDKYFFAAGTALGHAGEWKSFLEYVQRSSNALRLGQPLVAAAMNACIICHRYEETLMLFEELVDSPSVIQGSERLNPTCRDIAMRALGEYTGQKYKSGDVAITMFREADEEGLQISVDAIRGVIRACERDGNWRNALEVLTTFLNRIADDSQWLLVNDEMIDVAAVSDDTFKLCCKKDLLPRIGDMLSSTMRSCNSSGEFGIALLCTRFVDTMVLFDNELEHGQKEMVAATITDSGALEKSLLQMIVELGAREDILVSTMVALCGLNCSRQAARLYMMVSSILEAGQADAAARPDFSDARDCYNYATSLMSDGHGFESISWESANKHINRLTAVYRILKSNPQDISHSQRELLLSALARAMKSCTAAGQPESGLCLAKWIEQIDLGSSEQDVLVRRTESSYRRSTLNWEEYGVLSNKAVLAETICALRSNKKNKEALILMSKFPELSLSKGSEQSLGLEWTQVVNEVIQLLSSENQMDDAVILFDSVQHTARTPETYLVFAQACEVREQLDDMVDIYFMALDHGCTTESLGFIVMTAHEHLEGSLRFLNRIAADLSRASSTNRDDWKKNCDDWKKTRYWTLKRCFSNWYTTSKLMWWVDYLSGRMHELDLAIEHFEERQASKLVPENDILRTIVSGALQYLAYTTDQETVMPDSVVRIPRDYKQWVDLLVRVQQEAQFGSLHMNPVFVNDLARVLRIVGGNNECINLVRDAASRGLRVRFPAFEQAMLTYRNNQEG